MIINPYRYATGSGDPYFGDVLAQWDFLNVGLGDQKNAATTYDMNLNGSASRDGTDGLVLPGTSSDYADSTTTDASGLLIDNTGPWAYEVWYTLDSPSGTNETIMACYDSTGNNRSLVIRATSGKTELLIYDAGTNTPLTSLSITAGSGINNAGQRMYVGFYGISGGCYGYLDEAGMSFSSSTASTTITYGFFPAAEPWVFGRLGSTTSAPFTGSVQAARITNSARGVTAGGALTPDDPNTTPLTTS